MKRRDAVRLVTKPDLTSAHAGEPEVRSSEVVLHSAKPLPAAVPVWLPLLLWGTVNGVDQRDSGAGQHESEGIHFVRTLFQHLLRSSSRTTVP